MRKVNDGRIDNLEGLSRINLKLSELHKTSFVSASYGIFGFSQSVATVSDRNVWARYLLRKQQIFPAVAVYSNLLLLFCYPFLTVMVLLQLQVTSFLKM